MSTTVGLDVDPRGRRSRLRLVSGSGPMRVVLRPHTLSTSPTGARVAIVATGALLLAGDRVRIEVEVGPGAHLELVEPSGTVAYDMRGGAARWDVRIHLGAGAGLVWHGQPFVVSEGATVRRTTEIDLAKGATALLRETLVLGRTGEGPGRLTTSTRVSYDDRPVLVEQLDAGAGSARVGVLGPHRVIDTVCRFAGTEAIGTAAPVDAVSFALPLGGTMWRSLAPEAHDGPLDAVWTHLLRPSCDPSGPV